MHAIAMLSELVEALYEPFTNEHIDLQSVKLRLAHASAYAVKIVQRQLFGIDIILKFTVHQHLSVHDV